MNKIILKITLTCSLLTAVQPAEAKFIDTLQRGIANLTRNFNGSLTLPALFGASAAIAGYGWYKLAQDRDGNSLIKDLNLLLRLRGNLVRHLGVAFLPLDFRCQDCASTREALNKLQDNPALQTPPLKHHLFTNLKEGKRDALEDAILNYSKAPTPEKPPHKDDFWSDHCAYLKRGHDQKLELKKADADRHTLIKLVDDAVEEIEKLQKEHYEKSPRANIELAAYLGTTAAAVALLAGLAFNK